MGRSAEQSAAFSSCSWGLLYCASRTRHNHPGVELMLDGSWGEEAPALHFPRPSRGVRQTSGGYLPRFVLTSRGSDASGHACRGLVRRTGIAGWCTGMLWRRLSLLATPIGATIMWPPAHFRERQLSLEEEPSMEKFNKQQVAQRLQISVRKLEKMISDREFPPAVRVGKYCLWSEEVVRQYERSLFAAQEAWHRKIPAGMIPTSLDIRTV